MTLLPKLSLDDQSKEKRFLKETGQETKMLSKLFYFVAGTLSVVYAAETTGVAYLKCASDDYNSLTMKVNLAIRIMYVTKLFSHRKKKYSLKIKTNEYIQVGFLRMQESYGD